MKEAGFSLVEVLIVVAIIGILSAIAVPNLLRSRQASYEANALRYVKTWLPGQELYKRAHGHYADSDEIMVTEGFISKGMQAGVADDTAYVYSIDSDTTNSNGTPNITSWFGTARRRTAFNKIRSYYIDQTGLIRSSFSGTATVLDAPVD
jgi:prepilin-type N-terminal cleavage/methylation domain-containing protein